MLHRSIEFATQRRHSSVVVGRGLSGVAFFAQLCEDKTLKIAAIQAAPVFLDCQATTEKALSLMRGEAAANGAGLCVFPEVFVSGYPVWLRLHLISHFNDQQQKAAYAAYLEGAITADGPEMTAIISEANKLSLFTYLGLLERARSEGTVYCALAAIHPEQGLLSVHRKLKPTYHERMIWCEGDGHGLQVHEWRDFKVGGLNCFENWRPLARQALYPQGEQLHVSNWPGLGPEGTRDITRFIAMEGRVYVAAASGVLHAKDIPGSFPLREELLAKADHFNRGGSMIVEPGGNVLQGAIEDEEAIVYADIDVRRVREEHIKLDPAGHYGRPDVFSLKVNRERQEPIH